VETTLNKVLDTHYTRLAKDYDSFLYYSPDFVRALSSKMIEMLQLRPQDIFVDLACGTGMFSLDILKQVPLEKPAIGVDPYSQMLAKIPRGVPINTVQTDGLQFSRIPGHYDKILIKEAVHHITEREQLFANLHERLNPGGILLLVHVPPGVQYPLFRKALERCRDWHAEPDELTSQLEGAGFRVTRDSLDYAHAIPREHYFKMVENCYMSALTSLTDTELCEGLVEMRTKYGEMDILHFNDHFDYLAGIRS
jgi:trans-aconitate methyltransferase